MKERIPKQVNRIQERKKGAYPDVSKLNPGSFM